MADRDDDMTGQAARDANERQAARNARRAALGEDNAPSADAIGEAVAKALARAGATPLKEKPLGPVVRASVRAGYEDIRRNVGGTERIETRPKSVTFTKDETPDGKEYTVPHGKPIHLKREAYERRRDQGVVMIAE